MSGSRSRSGLPNETTTSECSRNSRWPAVSGRGIAAPNAPGPMVDRWRTCNTFAIAIFGCWWRRRLPPLFSGASTARRGRHQPRFASTKMFGRRRLCSAVIRIGHNGKASVRISRPAYRELKGHFLKLATAHRSTARLECEFQRSPFEPYGGVTRQMFAVLRAVNQAEKNCRAVARAEPLHPCETQSGQTVRQARFID